MVLGESFRVFKENEMMRPYNEKLRDYHTKSRILSTIYNQIVKEMHVNFSVEIGRTGGIADNQHLQQQ